MTFPAVFFGVLLSTAYGAAFHFWKGGSLLKMLLFLVLAWAGFWLGHLAGALLGWGFAPLGPIHAGMATLGSALFLFVGEWLSRVEVSRK